MPFTYNPSALDTDLVSYIRFILNDRIQPDAALDDGEIQAAQRLYPGSLREAASMLAEQAYAVAAAKASDMANGDRKAAWRDRAEFYKQAIIRIRTGALPVAFGGTSGSAVAGQAASPDTSLWQEGTEC